MATKYILAGGLDRAHPEYWDALGKEVKDKRPIKLLSCFFSQPKKNWELKFREFQHFFKRAFGEDVVCELANVDNFIEQVKTCDVVYLHGGSTDKLKSVMEHFDNIESYFKGKIVIGSSAGANFLSNAGWSPGLRKAMPGSGVVPVNVMVHFGSKFVDEEALGPVNWDEAYKQLQNYIGEGQEIVKLFEGKFVVFEK